MLSHAVYKRWSCSAQLPLIRELHATLLSGVRGHDKARGEFRTVQNYIGVYGRPVEESRFIPIPPEQLPEAMAAWERYVSSDQADRLVQLAIVHVGFESLHPSSTAMAVSKSSG